MNKLGIAILALAPSVALAHNSPGTLRLGVSYNHTSLSGAAANMPGLTLGVGGQYHWVGIRAGVSYARGDGASLETFGARAVASPHAAVSPYMSVGLVDLASLSGATSTATTYQVNSGGLITPITTVTNLPVRGVVMGYGFAGLRARLDLNNPRWQIAAHAGIGTGIGGSTTGLPTAAPGGSPFATSVGASLRYRVTPHAVAALTYTRVAIPVRGVTFRSEGVELSMGRIF